MWSCAKAAARREFGGGGGWHNGGCWVGRTTARESGASEDWRQRAWQAGGVTVHGTRRTGQFLMGRTVHGIRRTVHGVVTVGL